MKKTITFLLVGILLFSSMSVSSQVNENLLKIQGDAIIYAVPEVLIVNIPIQTKDSIYENCSKELINKYNQLKDALIKNNIDEKSIKSDKLSINENYSYLSHERKFDGYVGSINVTIELTYTANKLNSIINTLKNESFKFGYNLSFKLSENQKNTQLEKAIELAIRDAKNKADIIAKSINITLVGIQEINFGYTNSRNDLLIVENEMVFSIMDDDVEMEINLNPQMISIHKSIGIIWKIEQ
jgi:hypothetical protein